MLELWSTSRHWMEITKDESDYPEPIVHRHQVKESNTFGIHNSKSHTCGKARDRHSAELHRDCRPLPRKRSSERPGNVYTEAPCLCALGLFWLRLNIWSLWDAGSGSKLKDWLGKAFWASRSWGLKTVFYVPRLLRNPTKKWYAECCPSF